MSRKIVNGVSSDQKEALNAANAPTGANPVATMADVASEWTYTEVTVTAAQLDALHTTPKTLLPAGGANTYEVIRDVIFEYTCTDDGHASALDGQFYRIGQNRVLDDNAATFGIIGGGTQVFTLKDYGGRTLENQGNIGVGDVWIATYRNPPINTAITLNLELASALVPSDGILLIKIWHQLRTIGTEL